MGRIARGALVVVVILVVGCGGKKSKPGSGVPAASVAGGATTVARGFCVDARNPQLTNPTSLVSLVDDRDGRQRLTATVKQIAAEAPAAVHQYISALVNADLKVVQAIDKANGNAQAAMSAVQSIIQRQQPTLMFANQQISDYLRTQCTAAAK